jgi:rhamnosyltransferase
MKKKISIIIRTLNEEKYLQELIDGINLQKTTKYFHEIIIVDSGSNDSTLNIAKYNNIKVVHIKKEEFSFGRSLNIGCDNAEGGIFVFISGHCVPGNDVWLKNIVSPIEKGYDYVYGKQIGRDTTQFSETQVFFRQYPSESLIPQEGFFCNNANSAISKKIWEKYKFDESITGCEDMELAKRYVSDGGKVAYVANAFVYHIHNESWAAIRNRYEREALALQKILPEVHISFFDFLLFFVVGVLKDLKHSFKSGVFKKNFYKIIRYRFEQYYGSYKGNNMSKILSRNRKMDYFYPRNKSK